MSRRPRRLPPARRALAAALAALAASAGCLEPRATACDGVVCPPGRVCAPPGHPSRCVLPAQLEACRGQADEARCDLAGSADGLCVGGVCTPSAASLCGNGWVDPGEQCDCGDGSVAPSSADCDRPNSSEPDVACRPDCRRRRCGDGTIDSLEACDDGDNEEGDGCSASCLSDERCGNGFVDSGLGEECDDGDEGAGDGCSPTCRIERCGNGRPDPGEACDDGGNLAGDGCSPDCLSDESCGNGRVDAAIGERCDCGDDPADLPPGCAGPNGGATSACSATCDVLYCGNGTVDPALAEVCDDGNYLSGDGCSTACDVESAFVCAGEAPTVCASAAWAPWPMPDSPTILCGDGAQAVPCPPPGSAGHGQDGNRASPVPTYDTAVAGVVVDSVTGRQWQREAPTAYFTWTEALAYCEGLTLAGFADWRLPTRIELVSLVDYGRSSPAIDVVAFPATRPEYFWSSSPSALGPGLAWGVHFFIGETYWDYTFYPCQVRCVR